MYLMEAGTSEFSEHPSRPHHPGNPMGDIEIPDLDVPDLTDEDIEETLRGMGS